MRLLNTRRWKLKEFHGSEVPKYAILSHTWGKDEISFRDLVEALPYLDRGAPVPNGLKQKRGFFKIQYTLSQAFRDGIKWVWIDTCCIDNTSSAELSEAINSMFKWYRNSSVCYAYLEDVDDQQDPGLPGSSFRESRWFTRGWTLQELLAPQKVIFFSKFWTFIGERDSLYGTVEDITHIPSEFLRPCRLSIFKASVARRMAWVSRRQTTRVEDITYCLLGLFDINMPLLYGEGDKAFRRLQEEIAKVSNDQSLFAWGLPMFPADTSARSHHSVLPDDPQIFARTPSEFGGCNGVVQCPPSKLEHVKTGYEIDKSGLQIELPVIYRWSASPFCLGGYQKVGLLGCHFANDLDHVIGIPLGAPLFILSADNDRLQQAKGSYETVRYSKQPALLVCQSFIAQAVVSSLCITERTETHEHDLAYRQLYGTGSAVLGEGRSYPILLRDLSRFSPSVLESHPIVEITNRGFDFIIQKRGSSIPLKHCTQAHLSCSYGQDHFIIRIESKYQQTHATQPYVRIVRHSTVPFPFRMAAAISLFLASIKGLFAVEQYKQRIQHHVSCVLARVSREPLAEDKGSWEGCEWSESLKLNEEGIHVTTKKDVIMGADVIVVTLQVRQYSTIHLREIYKLVTDKLFKYLWPRGRQLQGLPLQGPPLQGPRFSPPEFLVKCPGPDYKTYMVILVSVCHFAIIIGVLYVAGRRHRFPLHIILALSVFAWLISSSYMCTWVVRRNRNAEVRRSLLTV